MTASPGTRGRRFRLYAALLLASTAVRFVAPAPGPLHEQVAMSLPVVGGGDTNREVRVAFADLPASTGDAAPVVLLITGSPARAFDLRALAGSLARGARVISPDLPGFGRSDRRIPDYSARAQAAYMDALLAARGVDRVHVVGYSMGGAVAVELAARAPDRIASITLLSAIGVQELELLGNYAANHALHGFLKAMVWTAQNIVPHFGAFDRWPLDVGFARSFFDTDQRPLRGKLELLAMPVLIVHGDRDAMVTPAVAREHHRIVPQSELVSTRHGHILAYQHPEWVAGAVLQFVGDVEAGRAATRDRADRDRAADAQRPFGTEDVEPVRGFALGILVLLIAFSTLISEDLACIAAGLLVAHGTLTFAWGAFAAFLGIFVGDLMLVWLGRVVGRAALDRPPLAWFVTERALQASADWFARRGVMVILLSRFIPGTRFATYFGAGALRIRLRGLLVAFVVATAVWAPLLVWLSAEIGERLLGFLETYQMVTVRAFVAVVVLLWLLVQLLVPMFSHRGRRLLVSRWRRLTHWEYWPMWAFYPPVLAWVALLAIRHRGLAVFTAANPAIPTGGFIGESKSLILRGLAGAGDRVAEWTLLPPGSGADEAVAAARDVALPVVAKPDVGQRGLGVAILKGEEDVRRYFSRPRPATVLQRFVPGREFGIFYIRHPVADEGFIFAITDKRFPEVTGDGLRSLERLILDDERAVGMARFYLDLHQHRLHHVPDAGERRPLVEIGTHCRGAVFLDGARLITPALTAEVERVSRAFDGFHFGRYDVRAASEEALMAGEFRVIELNGVTSEATSIYDPRHSVWFAWRTLFRQWRHAFEIGAANRDLGARPSTALELLRLLWRYRPAPEAE